MKSVKSLLLEAEVTISLSNPSTENKKVISIKKLSEIFEQEAQPEQFVEADEMTLQLKIDQLNQEIKNLQLQKEKVLQDLQIAIQDEKQLWEQQKEQEKQEAQEVGYKVGYDAGYEDALEKYESLLTEANGIVQLAKQEFDKTIGKHEQAIINLSIAVAEKITAHTIDENPELFKQIVEGAILDLIDSSNVEIFVHPSQYEMIMSQKEELEQIVRNDDVISIYTDKKLNEHSCIIKHPFGQIDASLDAQLQQLKIALEEKVMER